MRAALRKNSYSLQRTVASSRPIAVSKSFKACGKRTHFITWQNIENHRIVAVSSLSGNTFNFALNRGIATTATGIVDREPFSHCLDCGNSITALHDGSEAFPAIYSAIENAETEILLEMYWLASDRAGKEVVSRLIEARERGVNVKIIYDSFGCIETRKELFESLQAAGCSVFEFNPLPVSSFSKRHTMRLGRLKRRDHRKYMVVDRNVAFTGGINIAHFWLPVDLGGESWRDVMIRIEGPAAEAFADVFDRMFSLLELEHDDHDIMKSAESFRRSVRSKLLRGRNRFNLTKQSLTRWKETLPTNQLHLIPFVEELFHQESSANASHLPKSSVSFAWWAAQGVLLRRWRNGLPNIVPNLEILSASESSFQDEKEVGNQSQAIVPGTSQLERKRFRRSNIQIMTNDAWNDRRMIRRGYLMAINSAKKRITIVNSYFLPDRSLRKALYRAVRRGVKVEVVIPGKTDVLPYWYFTRARYEVMLRRGIQIYEWKPTVLHAKVAIFDDDVSVVGTYNFDPISFRNNLEIIAIAHNKEFTSELSDRIKTDMKLNCDKIEHWDAKAKQSELKRRLVITFQNFIFRTMRMFSP
mmetsp:Transcript_13951/g.15893  ORF Transcript_13951/g.15893 Transcript_13951/m.15893 type:complete len:585 (-) Transcript_13951:901-2655(-)